MTVIFRQIDILFFSERPCGNVLLRFGRDCFFFKRLRLIVNFLCDFFKLLYQKNFESFTNLILWSWHSLWKCCEESPLSIVWFKYFSVSLVAYFLEEIFKSPSAAATTCEKGLQSFCIVSMRLLMCRPCHCITLKKK